MRAGNGLGRSPWTKQPSARERDLRKRASSLGLASLGAKGFAPIRRRRRFQFRIERLQDFRRLFLQLSEPRLATAVAPLRLRDPLLGDGAQLLAVGLGNFTFLSCCHGPARATRGRERAYPNTVPPLPFSERNFRKIRTTPVIASAATRSHSSAAAPLAIGGPANRRMGDDENGLGLASPGSSDVI